MVMFDESATVKNVLKSTVDFARDFCVNRRMANSTCEMGANRTPRLVVVRETSGLPFECADPIVIGFGSRHSFIG